MSTPTVNVDLLRRVLEHITAHPEEWDQSVWARQDSCGTAYCLAGHTVVMTGHQVDWASLRGYVAADLIVDPENEIGPPIPVVARAMLGLDWTQADALFASENDLADLWRLASEYTDGAIEVPAQFRGGAA